MKKVLLAMLTLSVMLFAATAHANLITNGDFSDGLKGWNVSHSHAVKVVNGAAVLGHPGFGFGNTTISQSFYIEPGTESLNISFDLTLQGHDWNLLATDVAAVVLSTLQMEGSSWLFGPWQEWSDYTVYQWDSTGQYTTISVDTTVYLPQNYLDKNPNATISFMLGESLFGLAGIFIDTTMIISNVNVSYGGVAATPIPGAVWLMGTGIAGLVALRRRKAAC